MPSRSQSSSARTTGWLPGRLSTIASYSTPMTHWTVGERAAIAEIPGVAWIRDLSPPLALGAAPLALRAVRCLPRRLRYALPVVPSSRSGHSATSNGPPQECVDLTRLVSAVSVPCRVRVSVVCDFSGVKRTCLCREVHRACDFWGRDVASL